MRNEISEIAKAAYERRKTCDRCRFWRKVGNMVGRTTGHPPSQPAGPYGWFGFCANKNSPLHNYRTHEANGCAEFTLGEPTFAKLFDREDPDA
jgi:hypothetical protein